MRSQDIFAPTVTRRKVLKSAAALTVLVSVPRFAGAQSNRIVSTIFGGQTEKVYRATIVEPFRKKYGTEVVLRYGSPGQWLTSAIVNKDNPEIDLLWLTAPENVQAVIEDIVIELSPNDIPNLRDIEPVWYEGLRKKGVGFNYAPLGIGYRTDMISTPPTSWADFWKPEYKGKIAMPDIVAPGGIPLLVSAARLNGGSEDNIQPGFDAMKRIRPNVRRFYKNNVEGIQLLERGEVAMVPIHNGRVLALAENGIPAKWVAPKEGAYPGPVSFHIPKGTKDKELCMKFINFAISAEAQSDFASQMRYGTVNKKAKLTPEAAEWVPPLSSLRDVDWFKIIPLRRDWLERWNREVVS